MSKCRKRLSQQWVRSTTQRRAFWPAFYGLNFLASGPNVSRVAERGEHFAHLFSLPARVPTQALLATGCPVGVASGFGDGR